MGVQTKAWDRTLLRLSVALGMLATLMTPAPDAQARPGLDIDLRLSQRFNLDLNRPDTRLRLLPGSLTFDTASYHGPQALDPYYSLFAAARFSFRVTRRFDIVFDLDSGDLRPIGRRPVQRPVTLPHTGIRTTAFPPGYGVGPTSNGVSLRYEADSSFFLRELFIRFEDRNEFLFKAGRARLTLANGLLYDDSAMLLEIAGGERDEFWLQTLFALPTPNMRDGIDSPLVHVKADMFPERSLRIGIALGYMHDGGDTYANDIGRWFQAGAALGEAAGDPDAGVRRQGWVHTMGAGLDSWGHVGFLGLDLELAMPMTLLRLNVVAQAGEVGIESPAPIGAQYGLALPGPSGEALEDEEHWRMLTFGLAMELAIDVQIDAWTVTAWYLNMTGDSNPLEADASKDGPPNAVLGFTGIRPRLTHTNLMLSGGMNETLTFRGHDSLDLDGRGLIAGGLNVTYEDSDDGVYVEFGVAGLAPFITHRTQTGGSFYGVEVDLEAMYWLTDWLQISAEYDILFGGDAWRINEPIHQFRIGLDLVLGERNLSLR